ncbi:amidohydrolase family protein [Streptomyces sp. NPDC097619]|uniref:amidohydrolase family protein n=1 Tax=Streptomyces sp. NPDC097619 TaxID=3157228 RepID=UPI0033342141
MIVDAGPRTEVDARVEPTVSRLSFPNGTLLPGLFDAHVHLALDAGSDPAETLHTASDAELSAGRAMRAEQLLSTGGTTVRDLGYRGGPAVRLRDEITSGRKPRPRVLAAGTPLTAPGGHCWFLGGEVAGEAAIRSAVRRNAANGVDLVVVEGDPLSGLSALRSVRLVLAEGRPFGPGTALSDPPDARDR